MWESGRQYSSSKKPVCGGEARSCLLSFPDWAREKLPAGVGRWGASECAICLALWGAGEGAHHAATGQRATQSQSCPPSGLVLGLGFGPWANTPGRG